MNLGVEVDLGRGHIVLDGDPAPPPRKGHRPALTFRPISIVAKRLDGSRCHLVGGRHWPRRHCVRWGPKSPSPKGTETPIFGPRLLWPNRWMDQDATWYEGRPGPTDIVLDGTQLPPP